MKRIIYMLTTIFLFCMQSCVKDEKDLFDQSASERISAKLLEYNKILQEAPNGWKMEYFPETDQSMGGYTYFCTFQDGEVVMMVDMTLTLAGVDLYPAGTPVNSQYKLISDQGPVLSFDTYNPIFHYFSEPIGMIDTDGYAGDYEFVFMKQEGKKLIMKGKKYGNTMIMTQIESSAEEDLNQILETQNLMSKVPYDRIKIAGKEYTLELDFSDRQFIVEESSTEKQKAAFLFTETGIKLYKPVTINGEELYEFKLDKENKTITAINADATILRTPWIRILTNPATQYIFEFSVEKNQATMNDELFELLKEGYKANTGESFLIMYIGKNHLDNNSGETVIAFGSASGSTFYYPSYGCEFTAVGENNDLLNIKVDMDKSNMISWYAWCKPIAEYIEANSPYRLEDVAADSSNNIKCVSTKDPNVWFELK